MKSFLAYKFTCASCSSSYSGETCPHFKTRIEEHIKKDNKSHIFKHLFSTATCFDSYNSLCFKINDKVYCLFCFFVCMLLFHLLFSLSLTLIISIFDCLNYTSLLLHLITKHLVLHLSLSSIVFITSTLTVLISFCYYFISLKHTL